MTYPWPADPHISVYWQTRNVASPLYRRANRAMLRYYVHQERQRRQLWRSTLEARQHGAHIYPLSHKAMVSNLYTALAAGVITRVEWAASMRVVLSGAHHSAPPIDNEHAPVGWEI